MHRIVCYIWLMQETEATLCPINWEEFINNVDKAIYLINQLNDVSEHDRDRIIDLLEVDTVSGWNIELNTWHDAGRYMHAIVPPNATVPEVAKLEKVLSEIEQGTLT